MKPVFVAVIIALVAAVSMTSCERIESEPDIQYHVDVAPIPASYGKLVSVTTLPEYPNWVQLWFENDEGTITVVRIKPITNKMHRDILVYPRAQS